MVKRLIKLLHELGAIGVVGGLAACLVLVATAPTDPVVAYAATRQNIANLVRWLLVPSLALVIVSGLLSIAINEAYKNAGWAWIKALLGISMFEGTLLTVAASARHAAELSEKAVSGAGEPELLEQVLRTEWGGLWVLLAVAVANIVLAIWRPRFLRRQS
jgi:uncharacterized membrane protein